MDNTQVDGSVRISPERATEIALEILERNTFSREEAETIARHLVEAELLGCPMIGLIRLKLIVELVSKGRGEVRIVQESPYFAHIDGGGNPGYLSADIAVRLAIEKAKRVSFAVVGLWNSCLAGMAGYYVRAVAEAGLVGMMFVSSYARVAPFGGIDPLIGTNPMAFGFPAQPHPIVVDAATSAISNGEVELARLQGLELPPNCAVDSDGVSTRDPFRAQEGALLPFGRHKGYAFGLAMQLIGTLVGGEAIPSALGNYGFLFIVLDPKSFGSPGDFQGQVIDLRDRLKNSRRAPGVEEILIPGEDREKRRAKNLKDGIRISGEVMGILRDLSLT